MGEKIKTSSCQTIKPLWTGIVTYVTHKVLSDSGHHNKHDDNSLWSIFDIVGE